FMLFQIATVYAGALYDVNPLDQPGVELGKRLTYGLMGREGFERPELAEVDPRWVL
ncbi:MAG: glucose-6-phosphate isomerase, partial [Gemmatimonadetes bacterium]|nr:glucose-6-phosphate isomerase [Gemmatimonadota bacterium]